MMSIRPLPARENDPAPPTLSELARAAAEAAATIELGQAEQPLAELARALNARETRPWPVAVLVTSDAARNAVLAWLIGNQHVAVSAQVVRSAACVDLQLRARGYAIEGADGSRREFDAADDFSAALAAELSLEPSTPTARPLLLAVEAATSRADMDLIVLPESARIPALGEVSARLAGRPSLLLVAAMATDTFGDTERDALALLAPLSCALWPVLVMPAEASPTHPAIATPERTVRAWGLRGAPLLPLNTLDTASAASAPLPTWLTGDKMTSDKAGAALAEAVVALTRSRSAASVIEMLNERHESDLTQLRSRLKREQRLEKSSEGPAADAAARAELDTAKQRSSEDFTSLVQSLRESQRRALLKTGAFGQLCGELSQRVQPTDLERADASRVVRLTLDRTVTDETRKRFGKGARAMLDEQCIVIRDSFELVRKRCETALQSSGARNLGLPLESPDPAAVWATLRDVVQLELRYRGELPRRGFMQRLGAGRQVAFGILMVLSLVGSFLGFNVRQAALVGVLMLFVFAGVVGWTYIAWKREDQRSLELEIDKVREGVRAELERLAAEVSREMQTRLSESVEQARRDFLARFDAAQREWAADAATRIETERRDLRSRMKLIEQREREMATLGQQLTKLRLQASQLGMGALKALNTALQPAPGAGA